MIGEAARALDDPDGELSASMVATRPQGALRPRAVPPRPLEPGEVVARYRVVRLIGAGGAGLVHEAFDPQLGRRIALKMVRPDTSDEAARSPTRLLREAQAMARLSHPNVVAVYDAGIFEGQVFVAMELVDGRTVAQWLQETRPGWPAVVRLFVEAGRGLAAAHSAGLIHRDFKPENVLLGDDGRPRVTDFGLARARDLGDPTSSPIATVLSSSPLLTLTDAGVVAGTPAYMAPEQFEGARADERTDQFNFCAALYRALYGQRPFGGEATVTMGALAREVSTGKLRPPPPGTPVPDQVFSLVARGLARDPADRFPALAPLLEGLAACLTSAPRARTVRPRHMLVVPVIAGLAVAVAVVGARERARPAAVASSPVVGRHDPPHASRATAVMPAPTPARPLAAARRPRAEPPRPRPGRMHPPPPSAAPPPAPTAAIRAVAPVAPENAERYGHRLKDPFASSRP